MKTTLLIGFRKCPDGFYRQKQTFNGKEITLVRSKEGEIWTEKPKAGQCHYNRMEGTQN